MYTVACVMMAAMLGVRNCAPMGGAMLAAGDAAGICWGARPAQLLLGLLLPLLAARSVGPALLLQSMDESPRGSHWG